MRTFSLDLSLCRSSGPGSLPAAPDRAHSKGVFWDPDKHPNDDKQIIGLLRPYCPSRYQSWKAGRVPVLPGYGVQENEHPEP